MTRTILDPSISGSPCGTTSSSSSSSEETTAIYTPYEHSLSPPSPSELELELESTTSTNAGGDIQQPPRGDGVPNTADIAAVHAATAATAGVEATAAATEKPYNEKAALVIQPRRQYRRRARRCRSNKFFMPLLLLLFVLFLSVLVGFFTPLPSLLKHQLLDVTNRIRGGPGPWPFGRWWAGRHHEPHHSSHIVHHCGGPCCGRDRHHDGGEIRGPRVGRLEARASKIRVLPEQGSAQRRTARHTSDGLISGHFDLYDYLELNSAVGGIDITITPQPGARPAVLKLTSKVGPIRVRLADEFVTRMLRIGMRDVKGGERAAASVQKAVVGEQKEKVIRFNDEVEHHHHRNKNDMDMKEVTDTINVLSRVFETTIINHVGIVHVNYLVGNGGTTQMTADVGTMFLDLVAIGVGPHDPITSLSTTTKAGSQTVTVNTLDRWVGDGGGRSITHLHASHTSRGAGTVDITYPPEWQGTVTAQVKGAGSIDLDGRGLVLDLVDHNFVQAHRGDTHVGQAISLTGHGAGGLKFRC